MSDGLRAKELYKYYKPSHPTLDKADPTLTAFTQLVAWRLQAQRALVSLIDRETQYFVAEATKTLSLEDPSSYDEPGDFIWAGCSAVPKVGRLCEKTLEQPPPPDGSPAIFEICNLTEDKVFSHLPFISGPPHFQYYVGTPIVTKNGIPIGTIFALDGNVRKPISKPVREFLGTVAKNIMSHLQMLKEQEERKRALRMNSSLAAFVNPDLQKRKSRESTRESTEGGTEAQIDRTKKTVATLMAASDTTSATHSEDNTQETASEDGQTEHFEEDEYLRTFQRASKLLYEGLSLHEGTGGEVYILDSSASFQKGTSEQGDSDDDYRSEETPVNERQVLLESGSSMPSTEVRANVEGYEALLSPRLGQYCDILAVATPEIQTGKRSVNSTRASFTSMLISDLVHLSKKNPAGRLFDLDPETAQSSSSGEEVLGSLKYPTIRKRQCSRSDLSLIRSHFPNARQVIYVPLWNTDMARWVGCFIVNKSDFRNFGTQDFLFGIAFCNCVMMHLQKIATAASDQQKSDFIGSISHELRSPLHGILASCEFLQDTECDTFQHSLVDTASSCAHTLLDTINLVLDYSKLNAFERNARKARKKHRERGSVSAGISMMDPALNIYGYVDLALIAEEVIEGLATGHIFQNVAKGDGTDFSISTRTEAAGRVESNLVRKSDVEILVDIARRQSWSFVTQPGAFRRIIMNLLGNSLKYTNKGFIRVKLEADDLPTASKAKGQDREGSKTIVTLTVTDTGKGMSPDYLRTKLFTPFAQESAMNPGTGLGLSLVKSIVTMLGGEVSVKSAMNVGTEFVITLPMSNLAHTSSGQSNVTSSSSGSGSDHTKDNPFTAVKSLAVKENAVIFSYQKGDEGGSQREAAGNIQTSLKKYLDEWLGFRTVGDWQKGGRPSVVVVDELDLDRFMAVQKSEHSRDNSVVLVLCTNSSRQYLSKRNFNSESIFEFMSLPVGPHKLARALKSGLKRLHTLRGDATIPTPIPESESPVKTVSSATERMSLPSPGAGSTKIAVIQQGETLGRQESANALMAMDATPPKVKKPVIESRSSFPFPREASTSGGAALETISGPSNKSESTPETPDRSKLPKRPTANLIRTASSDLTNMIFRQPAVTPTREKPSPILEIRTRAPRLLLVDDNKINLRLLQTFMKKREYSDVRSAEDGAQAVATFHELALRDPPTPPDIVFMDLSMPVVDGFEATRQIRQIEAEVARDLPPHRTPAPSLIIALTGLASGRDQSKAFVSGFDLYMTKPTSFKEVARLLDNWETNGAMSPGVPHGAVTSEDSTPGAGVSVGAQEDERKEEKQKEELASRLPQDAGSA